MKNYLCVIAALSLSFVACKKDSTTPNDGGGTTDAGMLSDSGIDAAATDAASTDGATTNDANTSDDATVESDAASACTASTTTVSVVLSASNTDGRCANLLDGTVHSLNLLDMTYVPGYDGADLLVDTCPSINSLPCQCDIEIHGVGVRMSMDLAIGAAVSTSHAGVPGFLQGNANGISVGLDGCGMSTCGAPVQLFYAADETIPTPPSLATYGWAFSEGDIGCGPTSITTCATVRRNVVLTPNPSVPTTSASLDEGSMGQVAGVTLSVIRTSHTECHDPAPHNYAFAGWNQSWNSSGGVGIGPR